LSRKRRQVVLIGPETKGGGAAPLGPIKELRATLANFNTGTDGAPPSNTGTELLYGPGMVIEVPTSQAIVNQAIANLSDEELAWPVLTRLCKALNWKMMDIETGRVFGG